ncbi:MULTISPECIES: hypothetical protein [unclassified Streptomyces]|uniref:hypothetical protein n=1 Tax=unclassified Streptomyces TaxID=2593676 RepID=UPI00236730C0|nr:MULTISPECIES: hypothetical protein [unclassified Streptomyces]MDF3140165.1 hypothetical protein [Streptomyces sp. T21Q-yed]WDF41725.1 hypothetical protein PBV52_35490 [Streptomyces sp. T12]
MIGLQRSGGRLVPGVDRDTPGAGGENPSKTEIANERRKFRALWRAHVGNDASLEAAVKKAQEEGKSEAEIEAIREQRRLMRPDFSGKNYAALEVVERKPDGTTETHYLIDSSSPPLNRTEPSNANCADYLAYEFGRPAGQGRQQYSDKSDEEKSTVPEKKNKAKVIYGAGYRMGELTPTEMQKLNEDPKFQSMSDEQKAKEIENRRKDDADVP